MAMTSNEAKLIALGICFGALIGTVLPAKIVPLVVTAIVMWVNRRELMRGLRQVSKRP